MNTKVASIPAGYHSITPCLVLRNASDAIEFYKKAFNAVEVLRFNAPDGRIGYAELNIGDSKIMLNDEFPEMNVQAPEACNGTPVSIHFFVTDVDAVFQQACNAGAKVIRPVEDKFYGDRSGSLTDPFGHQWHIATRFEDVSVDELRKRAATQGKNLKELKTPQEK